LGALTPEALDLALPILRADSRLYRNYVYQPEPPLAIPITAYGGTADPSIAPEQLDGWREQTTASFIRREFEGDHFYLTEDRDRVFEALRQDVGNE
jgi:medium-chain acyl-[acyl-carrier-protein] hydrolase